MGRSITRSQRKGRPRRPTAKGAHLRAVPSDLADHPKRKATRTLGDWDFRGHLAWGRILKTLALKRDGTVDPEKGREAEQQILDALKSGFIPPADFFPAVVKGLQRVKPAQGKRGPGRPRLPTSRVPDLVELIRERRTLEDCERWRQRFKRDAEGAWREAEICRLLRRHATQPESAEARQFFQAMRPAKILRGVYDVGRLPPETSIPGIRPLPVGRNGRPMAPFELALEVLAEEATVSSALISKIKTRARRLRAR